MLGFGETKLLPPVAYPKKNKPNACFELPNGGFCLPNDKLHRLLHTVSEPTYYGNESQIGQTGPLWLVTCSTATDTQLSYPDTCLATHPKVAIAARIAPPPALSNRMEFGPTESERGLQAR